MEECRLYKEQSIDAITLVGHGWTIVGPWSGMDLLDSVRSVSCPQYPKSFTLPRLQGGVSVTEKSLDKEGLGVTSKRVKLFTQKQKPLGLEGRFHNLMDMTCTFYI